MIGKLFLRSAPYQGMAPILARALPLGLTKVAQVLREWWRPKRRVFDPSNHFLPIDLAPQEWSEQEESHLLDAFLDPLETQSLVADFAQTREGNCALVATIKAAMRTFGNRLFASITRKADGGFQVRLRDGEEVSLDPEDLARARDSAKLKGPDSPTKAFGLFAYAVAAARRAQLMPAVDLKLGFSQGWLSDRERFHRALDDLKTGPILRADRCGNGSTSRDLVSKKKMAGSISDKTPDSRRLTPPAESREAVRSCHALLESPH